MPTFLQVDIGFNLWTEILNVGGLVAVLLGFGLFVVWNKLSEKEAALAALNAQIKEDAKESMKIVTSFEGIMDRMLSEQMNGEKRIIDSMKSEFNAVKDQIREHKEHITEIITKGHA